MSKRVDGYLLDKRFEGTIPPPLELSQESPPDWALRTVTRNTGRRLEKRVVTYSRHTAYNYDDDYTGMGWGPHAQDPDRGSVFARAKSRREKRQEKGAAKKLVPRGSLGESDYQYWRGSSSETYLGAWCRWCERIFYNSDDRRYHFRKEGNCSHKIRATQDFAAGQTTKYCLACGAQTHKERWGFPLCANISCIGMWKFGHIPALTGWLMYKEKAKEAGVLKGWDYEKLDK